MSSRRFQNPSPTSPEWGALLKAISTDPAIKEVFSAERHSADHRYAILQVVGTAIERHTENFDRAYFPHLLSDIAHLLGWPQK